MKSILVFLLLSSSFLFSRATTCADVKSLYFDSQCCGANETSPACEKIMYGTNLTELFSTRTVSIASCTLFTNLNTCEDNSFCTWNTTCHNSKNIPVVDEIEVAYQNYFSDDDLTDQQVVLLQNSGNILNDADYPLRYENLQHNFGVLASMNPTLLVQLEKLASALIPYIDDDGNLDLVNLMAALSNAS